MDAITVRKAAIEDLGALVPAFAAAAAGEASNAWIAAAGPIPEEQYLEFLTESVRRYLAEDEMVVAERDGRIEGVSVWLRMTSTDRFDEDAAALAALHRQTGLPALERAAALVRVTGDAHPRRFPHEYLYSIAVVPEYRGRGAGGAILRHRLAQADAEGMPVYLEASTEDSARLYKRQGFEEHGERLRLAEGGPELIPMWREPGGR
jgi:ribosomal protein S18 acetylase RimI-like enzyme